MIQIVGFRYLVEWVSMGEEPSKKLSLVNGV
jgi:hypothetical protein